jgi:hypothetical protein
MNSRDQDKLLKEILPSEDLANFRQVSLERGLAGLRRERHRRHIVRFSAMAVALICLSLGIALNSRNTRRNQTAQIQPAPAAASPALASHVDFINDEQLLALFKNQPVALVGKPGEQRLVFLGQSESDSAPRQY